MTKKKKVIVVGGGFGGRKAVGTLKKDPSLDILLLDQRNYHLFQPLLYQVATAALTPANISCPIRSLFSNAKNVEVLMCKAESVDLKKRKVFADRSEYSYDYLILACGAQHTYFGHNEWEEFAPGLKNLEQALEIRSRILSAYEQAEKENDPHEIKRCLTFVIVGAGPTGVELSGAVAEIARRVLKKNFRKIDPTQTKIVLIEALDHILGSFHPKLALQAHKDLEKLGVEIKTSCPVVNIDERGVHLKDELIEARTVLWTAGLQAVDINKTLGVPLTHNEKVIVESDLSLKNFPEVFVIGDQAQVLDENKKPLAAVATVAIQEGHYVAKTIRQELEGKKRPAFHFVDRGSAAAIGKHRALIEMGRLKISGYFAWVIWMIIHIWYLTGGIENRLLVIIQWAWSYFHRVCGARIIYNREWRFYKKSKEEVL